jgi:hypothetical protein
VPLPPYPLPPIHCHPPTATLSATATATRYPPNVIRNQKYHALTFIPVVLFSAGFFYYQNGFFYYENGFFTMEMAFFYYENVFFLAFLGFFYYENRFFFWDF